MPNLLAHFGIQGLIGRAIVPRADLRWLLLGALLPDVGWILHRLLRELPDADPFLLRSYAIVQASLFLCLLLAGGIASLARAPGRVFAILASGSLLHLLLDASQTKWGNGVHLFAPFHWRLWNAGAYWPESVPTVALTLLGAAWVVWAWRYRPGAAIGISSVPSALRWTAALSLTSVYVGLPFALTGAVERSDSHYVSTLRESSSRSGKRIEFDRVWYAWSEGGGAVTSWSREVIPVVSGGPPRSGVVSIRARFVETEALEIEAFHLHAGRTRDLPSYLALVVLAGVWIDALRRDAREQRTGSSPAT